MKTYFLKILLFILPLVVMLLFPSLVIKYGKEYLSTYDIVLVQEAFPESLFGFAYNAASFYPYKKLLVEEKKPQVIALGTSRVMQFRKEFFTASTTFVNAGGAGRSLEDIESFIENLPKDTSINVIILGLDKEVFVAPYESRESKVENITFVRFWKVVISMSRRIYLDYLNNKFSFEKLVSLSESTSHVGVSALLHGDGFRADGSYRYGSVMSNISRVKDVGLQIDGSAMSTKNKQTHNFEIDLELKNVEKNAEALKRILVLAEKKDITVVGFMPPYPEPIYQVLIQGSSTLNSVSSKIAEVFKENKSTFFDFSSIGIFGARSSEFFDSVHGTDLMYVRMLVYMTSHTKVFSPYVNPVMLKDILKKTSGDFLDF